MKLFLVTCTNKIQRSCVKIFNKIDKRKNKERKKKDKKNLYSKNNNVRKTIKAWQFLMLRNAFHK